MTLLAARTLPESSHSGYVAAAYVVFFVLVLVYVAIMAWRLTRVERSVRELRARERESERAPGKDLQDDRAAGVAHEREAV